jgi:hypothetical protein
MVTNEAPQVFGVKMADPPHFPGIYYIWLPDKTAKRLPRSHLVKMLAQIFVKTVLPPKYKRTTFQANNQTCKCLNMHTFFRMLYNLGALG